jgi:hypothetical protein
VVSKCANHVDRHHYFTDTHVINSRNRPRSAGRSAVNISCVRAHHPSCPHTSATHTHLCFSQPVSQATQAGRING